MLWEDTQLLSMAVMFLAGAALSLCNDVFGLVMGWATAPRDHRRPARPTLRAWDFVLWLVVTPCVFAAALISDYGRLRVYVFVGLAAGAAAYLLLGRPLLVGSGAALRQTLVSGLSAFGRWLGAPLLAVRDGLARIGRSLGRALGSAGSGIYRTAGRIGRGGLEIGQTLGRWGRGLLGGYRRSPKE